MYNIGLILQLHFFEEGDIFFHFCLSFLKNKPTQNTEFILQTVNTFHLSTQIMEARFFSFLPAKTQDSLNKHNMKSIEIKP